MGNVNCEICGDPLGEPTMSVAISDTEKTRVLVCHKECQWPDRYQSMYPLSYGGAYFAKGDQIWSLSRLLSDMRGKNTTNIVAYMAWLDRCSEK